MTYIAIDESGSMTTKHCDLNINRWFCVSMVVIKKPQELKKTFKRWISHNIEKLRELDSNNKMFDGSGRFKELKSSLLRPADKINLLNYLCKNDYFEVLYIKIDNTLINDNFYDNTARAFNFVLGLSMRYHLNRSKLPKDKYHLYIDQRNTKTRAIHSLEDYLNIELVLEHELIESLRVEYQESHSNTFIQIADFFSNLYFSRVNSKAYNKIFTKYIKEGYLNCNFEFPIK